MNVLFVASECAPFVKTGGLADVIGAIPKALAATDVSVKVLIPAYPALAPLVAKGQAVMDFADLFGGPARIVAVQAEGLDLLLLEAAHLYDRPGSIYLGPDGNDWPDNDLRFAALSFAGARIGLDGLGEWRPDVINAHDWQAGLVPVYLRQSGAAKPPPVVMTIHNIAFQGLFEGHRLAALGLTADMFHPDGVEYFGKIGFLKGGLALCDKITTVSPTYAAELMMPEFGMGLEGLLASRSSDMVGILNGIDLDVWSPETDPDLVAPYSARSFKGKAANRAEVEKRFGLTPSEGPLFCVVSRLTSQKGLDLLLDCLPGLVDQGGRLALLGSGEPGLEKAFIDASNRYNGAVGTIIGYDEALSHLMQGGSDAILIPSRFEPCGLTQLYGLRYGTLPVVARTGGLADTVIDANDAALQAGCATGVQFAPINAAMLSYAIARTCALYRQPKHWTAMMRRAMRHPVGWDVSAAAYRAIFEAAQD
ncbi:glycogen synthase GlgA [Yoonia sediminilitoris]|uniref:Glycogen synthase n=1 Tax=Yoonia sediminilitoris TaxID=1286148 RepID=A0A2T6KQY8_9RHOB|nr:glycogen synthase GlgA [Yoonia sediminilitoris]PUB18971.1 starch synthase [Yoonia sediminilitoris]RCW99139.1 starch synthase [Yoonia sediminilitoris]